MESCEGSRLINGKNPEAPDRAGELGADMEPRALLLLLLMLLRLFKFGFGTGVLGRGAKFEMTSIPEITSMVPSNHPLLLLLLALLLALFELEGQRTSS